jgi:hypothetical protein
VLSQNPKFQNPNPKQISTGQVPSEQSAIDLKVWSLRFAWALELGFWDFPLHLQRAIATANLRPL